MVNPIHKRTNIFNDDIAFIEQYDFSQANLSEENRLNAITTVASICYQNPKAVGSESLYNRLLAESHGLPSSSFEFVPVLLGTHSDIKHTGPDEIVPNVVKFGETIYDNGTPYLLTNYRAIVYDVENGLLDKSALKFFNTEEECKIIKKHFKVFLFKVDFPTRSQMVRHRVNWQELSRRYVSGERVPFDFYISEKMKDIQLQVAHTSSTIDIDTLITVSIDFYNAALAKGIKPQEARRIIPQAAYTQIWGAFQPSQLANYFKLRDDEHAQWEIRQTAKAMKSCIILENYLSDMTPEREADIQARLELIKAGTAEFLTTEELELLLSEKSQNASE